MRSIRNHLAQWAIVWLIGLYCVIVPVAWQFDNPICNFIQEVPGIVIMGIGFPILGFIYGYDLYNEYKQYRRSL